MKKIISTIICLLPLAVLAQKGFTITGKIGDLNRPATAYLRYQLDDRTLFADSTEVKNGAFHFTGKVPSPVPGTITVKHKSGAPEKKPIDVFSFYLENADMRITSPDSVKNAIITGSTMNDDNYELVKFLKPVTDKMATLKATWTGKAMDPQNHDLIKARDSLVKLQAESIAMQQQFMASHPNSYIALSIFIKFDLHNTDFDAEAVAAKYNKFSPEIKSSIVGKQISAIISGTKNRSVGATIDFTQTDVNGKPVKLSDFKGKYVLIDFWASWCSPCRAENPNVVKAYKQLKNKNFEIIGVSLDSKKESWVKAIAADGLTWVQVSDLNGYKNSVSKQFGISAIPQNILVDPSGKIIAKNLRGEALLSKLSALLN